MSVDDLLAEMRTRGMVLTFLQQLWGGQWQAAVRIGAQDYERAIDGTAVAALRAAIGNADAGKTCEWRSIWTAGRSPETRPPVAAPAPSIEADIFA